MLLNSFIHDFPGARCLHKIADRTNRRICLLGDSIEQNLWRRKPRMQLPGTTRASIGLQPQVDAYTILEYVMSISVFPDRRPPCALLFICVLMVLVTRPVGHWGHIHQRTNQYEAELMFQPIDSTWKITGLELLQEARVNP